MLYLLVLSGMYAVQFVHVHVLTFLVPSVEVFYDFRFSIPLVRVCFVGIDVLFMLFVSYADQSPTR